MLRSKLAGLDKKTLRRWLILFFFALAIPTAILIQQSYSRLKWETYHQHQLMADELANRIDKQFIQLIEGEEQRPFTDYAFLNVVGEVEVRFFQRSPLSQYPLESAIPGLIGYFQVDSDGKMITPVVPEHATDAVYYGISGAELIQRKAIQSTIETILSQNNLVNIDYAERGNVGNKKANISPVPRAKSSSIGSKLDDLFSSLESDKNTAVLTESATEEVADYEKSPVQGQAAFDELKKSATKAKPQENSLGRVEDLALTKQYQQKEIVEDKKAELFARKVEKSRRVEQNILPEAMSFGDERRRDYDENEQVVASVDTAPIIKPDLQSLRINTFESEIDPFEFSQLESGHFVLFRKVWLNDQRYIQGLLIEQNVFLDKIIKSAFSETALAQMSQLLTVYQGNVLAAFSGQSAGGYLSSRRELSGELLYQTRLSDPLSDIELLFSITDLPAGPGGKVIMWLAALMSFVLLTGFYLMYRLGVGQINLANQQQDFVSAVSHELKTPLTSIRMYGEMLREGWASEDKKKTYYDFIFDESERLSRLINNVLHLAKMTRNEQGAVLKKITVAELMDGVRSKVSTQVERAGFEIEFHCDDNASQQTIEVDEDWFSQIMINLVDNAIKFSAKEELKKIELSCQKLSNGKVQFNVRDYGPGIDKQQIKKIFKLFYRTENELTRETVGTGIGLALVHQMVVNMNGEINVVNKELGAEFRIAFPLNQV
ncbi:MAG: HAMP domain-containing histidine kinase [Methylophaga sp.]|nr:HAMP domain-containing histidine kinase [Methylophaga sp.]